MLVIVRVVLDAEELFRVTVGWSVGSEHYVEGTEGGDVGCGFEGAGGEGVDGEEGGCADCWVGGMVDGGY